MPLFAISFFCKGVWVKKPFEGRAGRFLSKLERRAKPETEHFFPRWGKRCVFLNQKAGAYGFLDTQHDLSRDFTLVLSMAEIKTLTSLE